jgi:hypothetical protein
MGETSARFEGSNKKFLDLVFQNPANGILLERLRQMDLRDAWVIAGCLFQTVWNVTTGRPPAENIRDYDVFYFNDDDLSWEAENDIIRRVAANVRDLELPVQVRNQARVHLWYAEHFGPGYRALQSSKEGIDTFLIQCTRVGIHVHASNEIELYAPAGFNDLYEGVLRINPANARTEHFLAKARSYRERWPWLRIEE